MGKGKGKKTNFVPFNEQNVKKITSNVNSSPKKEPKVENVQKKSRPHHTQQAGTLSKSSDTEVQTTQEQSTSKVEVQKVIKEEKSVQVDKNIATSPSNTSPAKPSYSATAADQRSSEKPWKLPNSLPSNNLKAKLERNAVLQPRVEPLTNFDKGVTETEVKKDKNTTIDVHVPPQDVQDPKQPSVEAYNRPQQVKENKEISSEVNQHLPEVNIKSALPEILPEAVKQSVIPVPSTSGSTSYPAENAQGGSNERNVVSPSKGIPDNPAWIRTTFSPPTPSSNLNPNAIEFKPRHPFASYNQNKIEETKQVIPESPTVLQEFPNIPPNMPFQPFTPQFYEPIPPNHINTSNNYNVPNVNPSLPINDAVVEMVHPHLVSQVEQPLPDTVNSTSDWDMPPQEVHYIQDHSIVHTDQNTNYYFNNVEPSSPQITESPPHITEQISHNSDQIHETIEPTHSSFNTEIASEQTYDHKESESKEDQKFNDRSKNNEGYHPRHLRHFEHPRDYQNNYRDQRRFNPRGRGRYSGTHDRRNEEDVYKSDHENYRKDSQRRQYYGPKNDNRDYHEKSRYNQRQGYDKSGSGENQDHMYEERRDDRFGRPKYPRENPKRFDKTTAEENQDRMQTDQETTGQLNTVAEEGNLQEGDETTNENQENERPWSHSSRNFISNRYSLNRGNHRNNGYRGNKSSDYRSNENHGEYTRKTSFTNSRYHERKDNEPFEDESRSEVPKSSSTRSNWRDRENVDTSHDSRDRRSYGRGSNRGSRGGERRGNFRHNDKRVSENYGYSRGNNRKMSSDEGPDSYHISDAEPDENHLDNKTVESYHISDDSNQACEKSNDWGSGDGWSNAQNKVQEPVSSWADEEEPETSVVNKEIEDSRSKVSSESKNNTELGWDDSTSNTGGANHSNKDWKANHDWTDKKTSAKKDDNKYEGRNSRSRDNKLSQSFTTEKKLDPRMEREKNKRRTLDNADLESKNDSAAGRLGGFKQQSIRSYITTDAHKDKMDKEFDEWEKNFWRSNKEFKVVHEIQGDLFEQPKNYSLAHCVAEDLRMGSGIAVDFKREFKNLPDLLDQRAKQGGLATLHDEPNNRYVYYLVTKRESTGKPTYQSLWKSLWKMCDHIKEHKVKNLAVPRLGCGLDRLEWDRVKTMIEHIFKDVDIEIRVCNFQQNEDSKKWNTCKVTTETYPITDIEAGSLIFYFSTEDGYQDETMSALSSKFRYLPDFNKKSPKKLGDIIVFEDKINNYGLCGCIVRRNKQEPMSFKALYRCVQEFNKVNKKYGDEAFQYVSFQWLGDDDYFDDLINKKVLTIFKNFLKNVDIYVCTGRLKEEGE